MRLRLFTIALFVTLFSFLASSPIFAVEPYSPFSSEGNPSKQYYFDNIFPLYRYIVPEQLKIFENRDLSRNYEPLEICKPKEQNDHRDSYCDNQNNPESGCDGGDVNMCNANTGAFSETLHAKNGSCDYQKPKKFWTEGEVVTGKCRYEQVPQLFGDVESTDFAADNSAAPLSRPKYQNEKNKYDYSGNALNPITYGSHNLGFFSCDQVIKQLLVVGRALQTKQTVEQTKEWPLGWVDWGYKKTKDSKTLLDIYQELPQDLHRASLVIIEGNDDFFLNAGLISDYSGPVKDVCDTVKAALSETPPAPWAVDFTTETPLYSPSFRQGYARTSICVQAVCCPGDKCPIPGLEEPSKTLYGDASVSQAYGAALSDLFVLHTPDQNVKLFKQLAAINPLIRFASSAGPQAIPSVIIKRLDGEGVNPCIKYLPGPKDFLMRWFGRHLDYVKPDSFLGDDKACPDYKIQGGDSISKEEGGAFPQSSSSSLGFIWGTIDQILVVKFHYITVPDIMGQAIEQIEQPVAQTRDTVANLKKQEDYNQKLSNVVSAGSELLFAGKGYLVGLVRRSLAYWSCSMPGYSDPEKTKSIKDYVLGAIVGCHGETSTGGSPSPTPGGQKDTCSKDGLPVRADINDTKGTVYQAAKYAADKYNIPVEWLFQIYNTEGGAALMGDKCIEDAANANHSMGPLSIGSGAYLNTTCASERINSSVGEKDNCSNSQKLSRCSLEGSFILAARLLVAKATGVSTYDCTGGPYKGTFDTAKLWTTFNNYGGTCSSNYNWDLPGFTNGILDTNGRKQYYGDIVCNLAGACPPYPDKPCP